MRIWFKNINICAFAVCQAVVAIGTVTSNFLLSLVNVHNKNWSSWTAISSCRYMANSNKFTHIMTHSDTCT